MSKTSPTSFRVEMSKTSLTSSVVEKSPQANSHPTNPTATLTKNIKEKNMKKKILSLLTAFAMVFGILVAPFTTASADNANEPAPAVTPYHKAANTTDDPAAVTEKVIVHKIEMDKDVIRARRVTATVEEKEVTKVIIEKDGKYYDAASYDPEAKSNTALDVSSPFVTGFANGTPVFSGRIGLDLNEYVGEQITDTDEATALKAFFKSQKKMKDVYFALEFADGFQAPAGAPAKKGTGKYVKAKANSNNLIPSFVKKQGAKENKPADYEIESTDKIEEAVGGYTNADGTITFTTKDTVGEIDLALKGSFKINEIKEKSKYVKDKKDGKSIVDQRAVPIEITLPLINSFGTVKEAHVYPKNVVDKPQIDKNFHGQNNLKEETKEGVGKSALEKYSKTAEDQKPTNMHDGAQYPNQDKEKAKATVSVGDVVPYEVKTKIAKGTAYERLVWNDIMTNGLTYNKDLGTSKEYEKVIVKDENGNISYDKLTTGIKIIQKDAPKTGGGVEDKDITSQFTKDTDYKIVEDDAGFRLELTKTGLEKLAKITLGEKDAKGNPTKEIYDVEFVLTYTATVNGTAKVDKIEKNNVTLEYGHKPGKDHEEKPVKPQNGELKVTKNFEQGVNTDGLRLVYTLKKGNDVVASVALDNTIKNTTIDLGNGIKFVVGDTAFNGKFTGLPEGEDYKISERVAGYNPEYAETNTDGTVTITNKKDNDNPPPIEPKTPEVVVGGKRFVKTNDFAPDSNELQRLLDARFVVYRKVKLPGESKETTQYLFEKADEVKTKDKEALDNAKKAYLELIDKYNAAMEKAETGKEDAAIAKANIQVPDTTGMKNAQTAQEVKDYIDQLRAKYEAAFKTAGSLYEWKAVTETDPEKIATQDGIVTLASDSKGRFEIQGLAYGDYYLKEVKKPAGYAALADIKFEVKAGSYDGLGDIGYTNNAGDVDENSGTDAQVKVKNAQQVKNKIVTIPETGGIGSLVFIVAGLAIMAGAFVAYKKSQAVEA